MSTRQPSARCRVPTDHGSRSWCGLHKPYRPVPCSWANPLRIRSLTARHTPRLAEERGLCTCRLLPIRRCTFAHRAHRQARRDSQAVECDSRARGPASSVVRSPELAPVPVEGLGPGLAAGSGGLRRRRARPEEARARVSTKQSACPHHAESASRCNVPLRAQPRCCPLAVHRQLGLQNRTAMRRATPVAYLDSRETEMRRRDFFEIVTRSWSMVSKPSGGWHVTASSNRASQVEALSRTVTS